MPPTPKPKSHSSFPCPFCPVAYVHKQGLQKHLNSYIGPYRLPADGIHDMLKISRILKPSRGTKQRCPYCRQIFDSKAAFSDHCQAFSSCSDNVHDRADLRRRLDGRKWLVPFEKHETEVWMPKGRFPFLKLPPEIRNQIYNELFIFRIIEFDIDISATLAEPTAAGSYLQYNPPNNRLSLLLTCRILYHECRSVFFSRTDFDFTSFGIGVDGGQLRRRPIGISNSIIYFLIGISRENCMLLEKVGTRATDETDRVDLLPTIRKNMGNPKRNPWNNADCFHALVDALGVKVDVPVYGHLKAPWRLARVDCGRQNDGRRNAVNGERNWFTMKYRFLDGMMDRNNGGFLKGEVTFELVITKDDTDIKEENEI